MLRFFSFLALIIILSACSLQRKMEYTYVPPQSSMDKKCASQCVKGKRYCQQICQLKHPNCFFKADQQARSQYAVYQQEKIRKGEKITKTLRDFDKSTACYSECNCVPSFNTCYTACGGQVISH